MHSEAAVGFRIRRSLGIFQPSYQKSLIERFSVVILQIAKTMFAHILLVFTPRASFADRLPQIIQVDNHNFFDWTCTLYDPVNQIQILHISNFLN